MYENSIPPKVIKFLRHKKKMVENAYWNSNLQNYSFFQCGIMFEERMILIMMGPE